MSVATTKRGTPGHGRNQWDYEQRLCLDVLWNGPYSSLSNKQRAKAFNTIFEDHLTGCGKPAGLKPSVIEAQYAMRNRTDNSSWKATWERICATPHCDVEAREEMRGRIESVLGFGWDGDDEVIQVATPAAKTATPDVQRQRNVGGDSNAYATPGPRTRRPTTASNRYATPGPSTTKHSAAIPSIIVDAEVSDDTNDEWVSPSLGRRTNQNVPGSSTTRPSMRQRFSTQYATPGPSTRRNHTATFGSALDPYVLDDNEDLISSPLSGRSVSQALSAFCNTSRLNARKRPATIAMPPSAEQVNDDSDADYVLVPSKKQTATSPTVIIPPSPESVMQIRQMAPDVSSQSPKPKKRQRDASGRREGAHCRMVRRQGPDLWLYEPEFAEVQLPLVDVTEEAAHPNPPALLYRYWSATSHGRNSNKGFVSGRHSRILVDPRPPPTCDMIEWNDIALHLNNAGADQDGTPSPFISTTNLLVWVLRKALKLADPTAHISVIDTSKMNPSSIFHVPPFYDALKRKRPFFKGGFNYRGTHEHLIWNEIPEAAMVHTFSMSELAAFADSSKTRTKLLRLNQINASKSSAPDIIKRLKQANITISDRVAKAMAEIVMFMGLDHTSSREALSRAVFELAQGWVLQADGETQDRADEFVHQFCRTSEGYVKPSDQSKLKHAFLHGIQWSCGELNVHLKGPEAHRQMQARAAKKGLDDPARVVAGELDRMKLEAVWFEQRQQRLQMRLPAASGEEQDDDDDDDIVEEEDVRENALVPMRSRRMNPDVLYEY